MNSSLADLIAQGYITRVQEKNGGLEIDFNIGQGYSTNSKLTMFVESYQEIYDAGDLINAILDGLDMLKH